MKPVKNPLISVIVPVYGTEEYLRKCLDSILGQTYKNIELIIVNDGSEDHSEDIIKEYLRGYDNIKYVRHKENRGLFQARISGAEEATGDYIAFVDSDDYISSDYYRILIEKAQRTDCDICVANTVFEDVNGTRTIRQLYQLCFEGDYLTSSEIKEKFFNQQGYCFSWHTIWNKLYKKPLWDKCFPYYKRIEQHLIMTEDIAFSTPLLYTANSLALSYRASYFYCQHPKASTDASNITFKKFKKNLLDITTTFNFVEDFLNDQQADDTILHGFKEFRKKYSRMYRNLQVDRFSDSAEAKLLMDSFYPDYRKMQQEDEFCFDAVNAPFNDVIDYTKTLINDKQVKVVSFDVFDTLISRPFYDPKDLFILLDHEFSKPTNNKFSIAFSKMRVIAEGKARNGSSKLTNGEDITLSEIYEVIKNTFHISSDIVSAMYDLENQLEIKFCKVRETGKELYEFAKYTGKRIVITSDMYLELDTVEEILKRNGYQDYEKLFLSSKERSLKYSGNLFKKMLRFVKVKPEQVLHIGDTFQSDINGANSVGIQTFFLPKAKEAFENKINGIQTNNSAWPDKYIFEPFISQGSARNNFGYRTMLSLVANKFFDNPFVTFNTASDFNSNPYFIGYYNVGMHCIGLVKWLYENCRRLGYKNIYFLARDGYLPKLIFDIYQRNCTHKINSFYLYGSRSTVLPFMVQEKADLFDLPLEKNNHTPLSICRMLDFCLDLKGNPEEELSDAGFVYDGRFKNDNEFYSFIAYLADNYFSQEKLKQYQKPLSAYYSCIKEDSVLFDMGYSGRIQQAISYAVGHPVDAFYVHMDNDRSNRLVEKNGFSIYSYYNGVPASTGVLREYLLSDVNPSCTRIVYNTTGELDFIIDESEPKYPSTFITNAIHRGAIDLANDFISTFANCYETFEFNPLELSAPFEYFLRFAKTEDRKFLSLVEMEDKCYGNLSSVRADRFFNNQLCDIPLFILPNDFRSLQRVDLLAKMTTDQDADEELEFENESCAMVEIDEDDDKIPAIFLDLLNESDNIEDKFSKSAGNTSNLLEWDSIIKQINPVSIPNWYMTNTGGFNENDHDVYLTTNLTWIEENADLTYLEKVLERIGDKVLLPISIGFSTTDDHIDFVLSDESIKTLAAIAERCKSIGVKGEYSAEVLQRFSIKNIDIIGAPSVYQNMEQMRTIITQEDIATVVSSFKPFYGKLSIREKKLLSYLAAQESVLIDTTALELKKSNLSDDKLFARIKAWEKKKAVYFDIDEWRAAFDGVDFAFGMNFANNIIAMQSSVPALFINYESIGRELCKHYALPSIDISDFDDKKRLIDYYSMVDLSEFKKRIDKRYSEYCAFLKKNGIKVSDIEGRIIEK